MKLSIVIVTYNCKPFIDRCLEPLLPHIGEQLEVLVWDNASSDGTYNYLKCRYDTVRLFGERGNLGFARGNNAAFKECRGDYVLLLNPDAFLHDLGQIECLLHVLEADTGVGAVGPMLINADGSHQVGDAGWRHDLPRAVAHFLFLHKLFGFESIYLTSARFLERESIDLDWVSGGCTLVSRKVIEQIGGLNDDIFMYGEDVEWCVRIRNAGLRVVYVPSVRVHHLQGATQKIDIDAAYSSTKWLDALAAEIRRSTSAVGFFVFKAVATTGLLLRWTLLLLAALGRADKRSVRAAHMLKYARFVIGLSYAVKK
ncbi:glycosyltransferase family 2 protein [Rhodoplanes elegans]|nr:glycosyltransferase family 2 protein [Rhodoplanes elegans]